MLVDLVYTFNIVLSFIIGFYLILKLQPIHHKWHVYTLALFYILNAFCFSFYLLIKYEFITYVPFLYKIPAPINFLIAPAAYFHLKFIVEGKVEFKPKHFWHLIPFVVFLISYLGFYFMPYEEKLAYVNLVVSDFSLTYSDNVGILPEYVNSLTRLIHPFFYLVLQWVLITSKKSKELKIKDSKLYHWTLNFVRLQTFFIVALFLTVVLNFTINQTEIQKFLGLFSALVTISFFFTLTIYLFWNQDILRRLKYFSANKSRIETSDKTLVDLSFIEAKVIAEAYYKETNLSISKLSDYLETSTQELSRLINMEYTSYNAWINELRVKNSIELINQGYLSKHSVEALAFQVGFSSKNTFYRSFKKLTNTTPSQFLKELKAKKALNITA